jgi:tetratricopeptide (TPR) repeat protein
MVDSTTSAIGKLHFVSSAMSDRVFELTQDRVNVGRDDDNLISIDHSTVSLHHAILIRIGTHYKVRDLISTNGTFVNGERVTGAELRHGDYLSFGEVEMRYEEPGQAVAEPKKHAAETVLPLGRTVRPIAPPTPAKQPAKDLEYRIVGADGRTYGPVDATQLRKWIAAGYANEHTWVPAEARRNWKQLVEFPEFAEAIRATPTPTELLDTPPADSRWESPVKVAPIVTGPEFVEDAAAKPAVPSRWRRRVKRGLVAVVVILLLVAASGAGLWWFDQWPFGSRGPLLKYGHHVEGYVYNDPDYVAAGAAEDAKNYTELLKDAKALSARYPDSPLAQFILGESYAKLGFFPDASSAFHEAIKLKPDYIDAWFNLGWAYSKAGNLPEAVSVFQQLTKLAPEDPQVWENLGGVYAAQGHPSEAVGAYKKAIELKPDFADAHFKLGAAYAGQGQYPEAINAFRLALKFQPEYPDAWFNLGVVSEQQNEHNEAVLFFTQSLKQKPNYAEAWGGLVRAYLNLHQTDKAGEAAREMKKIDPVKANQLAEELSREAPAPITIDTK